MTPFRLTPDFRERIWGTTHLEPWFLNSSKKIGEVWFEGVDDLPLLVKFIFTSENLSVQVHPDDSYAAEHHDSRGKTEMWHILAAQPGAKIAAGFRDGISVERLEAAAVSGEIENLLQWFEAKPGDTFFIPAGTVHAIGAGLTLCEIQQHSDVTYRLYDYGRPRELHLQRAKAVSHRSPFAARQASPLIACDHFVTKRLRIDQPTPHRPIPGLFELLIVIEGAGQIAAQPAKPGDVWYVPPDALPFELTGSIVVLQTSPPR